MKSVLMAMVTSLLVVAPPNAGKGIRTVPLNAWQVNNYEWTKDKFSGNWSSNIFFVKDNKAYHKTETLWKTIYKDMVSSGTAPTGISYIGPLPGNGLVDRRHKNKSRDTIIFMPMEINLDKPVDVIVWLHGLGGFKKRDFETRVLKNTNELVKSKKNFIIIIPEMPWSKNTDTPRTRQGRVFVKKDQFATFMKSATAVVNDYLIPIRTNKHESEKVKHKLTVGKAILIGHSAGGSALMSISRSGGLDWLSENFVGGANDVKIVFSDAGYGYWTDHTWLSYKKRTDSEFVLLVRKGDKPHKHTKRFLKRFRKKPANIKTIVFKRSAYSHSDIGDQALMWAYRDTMFERSGCGEGKIK